MTLDLAVARAVFLARQIERAVHDSGPWEIAYGAARVPACRFIRGDSVVFVAHLPNVCYTEPPEPTLTLLSRGEEVGSRPVEHPGDGEYEVTWEFTLGQPALA
jgi:hypothetical protein